MALLRNGILAQKIGFLLAFQTNVLYTYRKGPDAIHFCDSEIEVGKSVELEIDWSRRFDHMQQHTGQHLISAIFDVSSNRRCRWYP